MMKFPLVFEGSNGCKSLCFPRSSPPLALAALGCLPDELCSCPFRDSALQLETGTVLGSSLVGGHPGFSPDDGPCGSFLLLPCWGIAGSVDLIAGGSSGSSISELSPVSISISHLMSLIREDTENRASISLSF